MPISWNEIRNRAYAFVNEWKNEIDENAEAKSFWDEFFQVFGVSRRRVATFEKRVHKSSGKYGFIDLLWKGTLLIEHKSRGKDLDRAHSQATDYFPGLKDEELPRYIIVCDFANFRMYDLEQDGEIIAQFTIDELPDNLELFGFIAGYQKTTVVAEDPVNIEAAEKMAKLHDKLKKEGYEGHDLEVMLVRLVFCLFSEDTGVFERSLFRDLLINYTREDGSDLGMVLAQLFQTLNQPEDKRQKTLPQHFADFAYINGKLFEEQLPISSFNSEMRQSLLDATTLNWSYISPAMFGSLFQGVMDTELRRNLGAHYTEEANILKVVKPLFLDGLWEEFKKCKKNRKKLIEFHNKLASLIFFDPACGCGNFLVITYRELRHLELEVLKALFPKDITGQRQTVISIKELVKVNVDQFYGIEIEEFPSQIAQTALWLTDHQMNLLVSEAFGLYFVRLPLTTAPHIFYGNALEVSWENFVDPTELNYILGNPPFGGSKYQSKEQRSEVKSVASGIKRSGILDYVTAWYLIASKFIQDTKIEVGFVSTNSITQGEQVDVLWSELINRRGVYINFCHRTFQWTSEARGKAAVHCVIIGFSQFSRKKKFIYDYETPKSEPRKISAQNINPYLVDGPSVTLPNRSKPICDIPSLGIGNKPIDGGNYLFLPHEKEYFLIKEPHAEKYFRRWVGAQEFLNSNERWCLWLGDCPPNDLRKMPEALKRVDLVKKYREASKSAPTRKLAKTPTRFHVENMPKGNFLVIPGVSSERREYIPIGFMPPDVIASNLVNITGSASLYHFGVLSSSMHMAWMRYVAGRLKSDYRYSIGIVYNNFPWPEKPTEKQTEPVEKSAQSVIDVREKYPDSTLSDLYDPLTMPQDLRKAHQRLDKAVDKCYRPQAFTTELNRVEYLFSLYEKITAPIQAMATKKASKRKKKARCR